MRRLTATTAALLLAAGVALAAPGAVRAQDNAAVAINTKDGGTVFRFAFNIARVGSDVVDNTNAAVAYASCTDCTTVAIAIQVVLVTGDPSVVSPENYAIAINQQCTLCETLASAYQFVFGTGGPVHFTAEGNQELAQIRREFQQLRKDADSLTAAQIQARVAALVDRLRVVLQNELVAAGDARRPEDDDEDEDEAAQRSQPAPPPPATETETTPTQTDTTTTPPPPATTETETTQTETTETETTGTETTQTETTETTTTP